VNAYELKRKPAEWMPWNYRDTLQRADVCAPGHRPHNFQLRHLFATMIVTKIVVK
jgi:hypothetical protein